jgi:uncharacterized protein
VQAEIEALLALQAEDDVVEGITERLDGLAPRLAALDTERERVTRALQQMQTALEADERKKRELEQRLSDHRQRHEKNLAQLDMVKRMREATAAMAQVEMGRKILLDGENELRALSMRVTEARRAIEAQEQRTRDLEGEQAAERERIGGERASLDAELGTARAARDTMAARVPNTLRAKYDRIRGRRRSQSVFALANSACSACDTSIPVQRRQVMANGGSIDVCEACGVLLYATE